MCPQELQARRNRQRIGRWRGKGAIHAAWACGLGGGDQETVNPVGNARIPGSKRGKLPAMSLAIDFGKWRDFADPSQQFDVSDAAVYRNGENFGLDVGIVVGSHKHLSE